jgi:excisionase family DNA binding protein
MRTHQASPTRSRPVAPAPDDQGFLASGPAGATGRLLVAEDVAALLGVPPTFVYSLARRGELPCVRVGERYVRFRAQAVEAWIEERESTHRRGTQ